MILYLVVRPKNLFSNYLPPLQQPRDIHPLITILFVGFDEKSFLRFAPGVFSDVWVKFIVPPTSFIFDFLPFSTLLAVSLLTKTHVV